MTAPLDLPPAGASDTPTLSPELLAQIPQTQAPAPDPTPALPASERVAVPGYEILGELGRGGMGVVYKARQVELNRTVALKMILAGGHASPAELARFRTEARAVARLQHPNIIQIHEVGEHDGLPFFSLEYCGGGNLEKKLAGTPLSPREAASLVRILAGAMQAAHDRGVVHRDLKPVNVLLAEDGTPKITDFGLARKLDEAGQTATGAVLGTPSYMAPEQAGGSKDIGPPADIYALGAILYECLTGRPPFRAATALDTLMQVVADEPVPPSRLAPKVPRDLENICLKCLQKEPHKRYATAQALADDLAAYLEGRPTVARPATRMERLGKWVRRRPAAAALAVLAVLAPVSLLVLGLFYNARLQQALADVAGREQQLRDTQADADRQQQAAGAANSEAKRLLQQADSLRLSALSSQALTDNPGLALLLAIEGAQRGQPRQAPHNSALLAALEQNRELHTFSTVQQTCLSTAFSQDGRRLAVNAGTDLSVWDISDPWKAQQVWKAAEFPFQGSSPVALSPDGRWVAKFHDGHLQKQYDDGSRKLFTDRVIQVWDTAAGSKRRWVLAGHTDRVSAVTFSPDSRNLLTGSWDGTARLWDLATGKPLAVLAGHSNSLAAALFTPDGSGVLTVSHGYVLTSPLPADFKADVTDPPDYTELAPWTGWINGAVFQGARPDDGVFARLWDVPSGKERVAFVWPEKGRSIDRFRSISAAFRADGRQVAFGFEVGSQRAGLWEAATGRPIHVFPIDWPVHQVAFSQDG
jgi:WD40 repeat protein